MGVTSFWILKLYFFIVLVELDNVVCFGKGERHSCQRDKEVPNVPLIFKIADGLIQGSYSKSRDGRLYGSFKGIPYAKKPTRFEPPEFPKKWIGILNATEYKPRCAQVNTLENINPVPMGSEDCLYLNVFSPKVRCENPLEEKLPVMVFFETGGFTQGGADRSGPNYFMDENIVLVTFNYRLGAFGFLSTGDEVVQGNMGLKDQLLVLKWVQKNIQAFCGNPREVTIFGESAGGSSVTFHLMSPLSKGLFKAAISQSGSGLNARHFTKDLNPYTKAMAWKLGCPIDNSFKMITCLKERPMEAIRDYKPAGDMLHTEAITFTPTIENPRSRSPRFLTDTPTNILNAGAFSKVPLILTINSGEGLIRSVPVLKSPTLLKDFNENWFEVAPIAFHYSRLNLTKSAKNLISSKLRNFYFGSKSIGLETFENLTDIMSDSLIMSSVKRHALVHGKYAPVFTAVLDYSGIWSQVFKFGIDKPLGVAHSDDLQYLFTNKFYPNFTAGSLPEYVSKYFVHLWANFAKFGNPNFHWRNVTWRPVTSSEINSDFIQWLYMKDAPEVVVEPLRSRLSLWDDIQLVISAN